MTTFRQFVVDSRMHVGGGGRIRAWPRPDGPVHTCPICGAEKDDKNIGGGHGGLCPNAGYTPDFWIGWDDEATPSRLFVRSSQGEKGT